MNTKPRPTYNILVDQIVWELVSRYTERHKKISTDELYMVVINTEPKIPFKYILHMSSGNSFATYEFDLEPSTVDEVVGILSNAVEQCYALLSKKLE